MLALRSQIFEIFWEQVLRKIGTNLYEIPRAVTSEREGDFPCSMKNKVNELLGSSTLVEFIDTLDAWNKVNQQRDYF